MRPISSNSRERGTSFSWTNLRMVLRNWRCSSLAKRSCSGKTVSNIGYGYARGKRLAKGGASRPVLPPRRRRHELGDDVLQLPQDHFGNELVPFGRGVILA